MLGKKSIRYFSIVLLYVTPASTLSPGDPRFVGAWWLAFMVIGTGLLFLAIPLFCFPAKIHNEEKSKREDEGKQAEETGARKEKGIKGT